MMNETRFFQVECNGFSYKTFSDRLQKISDQMKEQGYIFKDMYPVGPNFWCYILVFYKEDKNDVN